MKNLLKTLIGGFFLCVTVSLPAQYDPAKINKKAIEAYEKGLEKAEGNNFQEAISLLQDAIQKDPGYVEAYLSLAGVYGQIKSYQQSTTYYKKAFALDSNYTFDFRLPYSINLAGMGEFEKALKSIDTVLSKNNLNSNTRKAAEYRRKTFQFAVDYAKSHPGKDYVFAPQNLGDAVNSVESEYFPS